MFIVIFPCPGVWGVDFMNLRYRDEPIKSVALYEETIKPRPILPIIHPYVFHFLCVIIQRVSTSKLVRLLIPFSRFGDVTLFFGCPGSGRNP